VALVIAIATCSGCSGGDSDKGSISYAEEACEKPARVPSLDSNPDAALASRRDHETAALAARKAANLDAPTWSDFAAAHLLLVEGWGIVETAVRSEAIRREKPTAADATTVESQLRAMLSDRRADLEQAASQINGACAALEARRRR
jgi:hypothetical protein